MSLIIFNTRHALPLSERRFLRPRSNRGEARNGRAISTSWTWHRRIQGREQGAIQDADSELRARTIHVHVGSRHTIVSGTIHGLDLQRTQTSMDRHRSADTYFPRQLHLVSSSTIVKSILSTTVDCKEFPRSLHHHFLLGANQCPGSRPNQSIVCPI